MSASPYLYPDFKDLLALFQEHGVAFLVIGAHALSLHGIPRATGDIDLLLKPSKDNAQKALRALQAFGAPTGAHGVSLDDLQEPGMVYQIGLPPRRIDLMTSIDGLSFEEAEADKVIHAVEGLDLPFIGRAALIVNKRSSRRPKDLLDLALLTESAPV